MKRIRIIPALILTVLFAALISGCGKSPAENAIEDAPPEQAEFNEEPSPQTFRRTTVYYRSDDGFIVPVTKLIPWEEGIARAALSYMVSTPANLSAAREMGLNTVIPDGVTFELSIIDGNAKVDISGLAPMPSRESEDDMLRAIVNTLIDFPTVSTVTVTRDGAGGALENGALLPVRQTAYALNPEEPELAASTAGEGVTLYFPNSSGTLIVPVTRLMDDDPGLYGAVSALISGARSPRLMDCFPEDTLLLGAAMENGVVTVNLSEDFRAVESSPGLFTLAYRTVMMSLAERYDIARLRFQINGVDYEPESPESFGETNIWR